MEEYNELLVKNCIKKSEEALSDASFNFENKRYSVTLNRVYYSIFYSVSTLAYKNNFITSKHAQLKGWFNKTIIFERKLFDEKMLKIYQKAYNDRQESDYEIIKSDEIDELEIQKSIEDARFFINNILNLL